MKKPGKRSHPLYWVHRDMLARCSRPTHHAWDYYGGRGITVCDRWKEDFWNFVADVGERPEGLTLDRIDVNGNYEPDNIRWATRAEQTANRRTPKPSRPRTHCNKGLHEMTPENTRWDSRTKGIKRCRQCAIERRKLETS